MNTGVNRNSAVMYVYAVKNMLNGQVYKRAISQTAKELFFQYILSEFGKEALKNAISSTRSHIAYRRNVDILLMDWQPYAIVMSIACKCAKSPTACISTAAIHR